MFYLLVVWQHLWLPHLNTLHIHHSPHSVNNVIQIMVLVGISGKPFHHAFKIVVCLLGFYLELIDKTILFFFLCVLWMTKRMKQAFKTIVYI